MKAVSVIGGVGSMLIGAKEQGWDILCGFDWRPYYHTGTFEYNFGVPLFRKIDDFYNHIAGINDIDLVIGHTECGNYSQLRATRDHGKISKRASDKIIDPGDIPIFVSVVQRIKPRFFVMDNLPNSLMGFTVSDWLSALPGYDIFFEYVSNYNYGNPQKHRHRLFVIGVRSGDPYYFIPGEFDCTPIIYDYICDLPKYDDIIEMNHVHRSLDIKVGMWEFNIRKNYVGDGRQKISAFEWMEYLKSMQGCGRNVQYYATDGSIKYKPGVGIADIYKHSPVLRGAGYGIKDAMYRNDTYLALTVRERARIQGAPDTFIFHPLHFVEDERVYIKVYTQTGKFMPVQFCTFITKQIMDFISTGRVDPDKYTGKRFLRYPGIITQSKIDYCRAHKYTNQDACSVCPSKSIFCNR